MAFAECAAAAEPRQRRPHTGCHQAFRFDNRDAEQAPITLETQPPHGRESGAPTAEVNSLPIVSPNRARGTARPIDPVVSDDCLDTRLSPAAGAFLFNARAEGRQQCANCVPPAWRARY